MSEETEKEKIERKAHERLEEMKRSMSWPVFIIACRDDETMPNDIVAMHVKLVAASVTDREITALKARNDLTPHLIAAMKIVEGMRKPAKLVDPVKPVEPVKPGEPDKK